MNLSMTVYKIAIVFLGLFAVSGCTTSQPHGNFPTPDKKRLASDDARAGTFFICCGWQRRIPAGFHSPGLSDMDFLGVKTDFIVGMDNEIMLVYKFHSGMWGKTVHLKLTNESGVLCFEAKQKLVQSIMAQGSPGGYWLPSCNVTELYERGGTGEWKAEWYIEGCLEKTLTFTIRKKA